MTTAAGEEPVGPRAAEIPPPPRSDPGGRWPWATWELHETVAVAMAPFGVALVATIALFAFGADRGPWLFCLTLVQQLALGLGIWWWVRVHTGSSTGLGIGVGGSRGRDLGAGVAAGFGALFAASVTVRITQILSGTNELDSPLDSAGDAWVVPNAVLALVLAPICEEIAFRGFLFGGLRRRWPFAAAAAASAALFAVIHGDPVRMPALFVSGMILAAVYERRRSLLAPIGTHALVNLVSVLAFFWMRAS